MRFSDIQIDDKVKWGQYQQHWKNDNFTNTLGILSDEQLAKKGLTAKLLNDLTDYLVQIQNTKDDTFKQDNIPVQETQPTQNDGEIWFQVTGTI
jgi:hypothetical protein